MSQPTGSIADYLSGSVRPPAVVVGLCPHGLAIVRSLEKAGIRCLCLESNFQQPSVKTRYGLKIYCPDIHGPALLPSLLDLADKVSEKMVLFLTNDKMLRQVAGSGEVRERYLTPVPDSDLLRKYLEKDSLFEIAKRKGISLPKTMIVNAPEMIAEAGKTVGFPCIFKPAKPMSAFKVFRIGSLEELERRYAQYRDVIDRFLVQEWIPGNDSRIFFGAYCLGSDSRPVASFSGRKIRQYPKSLGNTSASEGYENEELMKEGARLFEGSGLRGFVSTEYKEDSTGCFRFIEVTIGRSDYWLETTIINGVDFPVILYNDLIGRTVEPVRQNNQAIWVDLSRDLPVFIESLFDPDIPKSEIVRFLRTKKKLSLAMRGDMKPLFHALPKIVGELARSVWRRIMR